MGGCSGLRPTDWNCTGSHSLRQQNRIPASHQIDSQGRKGLQGWGRSNCSTEEVGFNKFCLSCNVTSFSEEVKQMLLKSCFCRNIPSQQTHFSSCCDCCRLNLKGEQDDSILVVAQKNTSWELDAEQTMWDPQVSQLQVTSSQTHFHGCISCQQ